MYGDARLERGDIAGGDDDALGKQKAGGEMAIVARRPHEHRKRFAIDANLQRFLDGGGIRGALARAVAKALDGDLASRL
jgi:hypothetical protein